jgi:hypothetical protein
VKAKAWYRTLLFLLPLYVPISAQEFRVGASAVIKLYPKLNAELELETRKIFHPESYHSQVIQGELNYSITSVWNTGVMFGHSFVSEHSESGEEEENETSERNKIALDLVYQPKRFRNDLRLTNRFRYQWATADDSKPKQYLRNRVTLDYRMTKKMNPSIAIEPYYSFRKNKINIVRLYLGNEMPVIGTTVKLYYIAEVHLKVEGFFIQYVVGATLKLDFDR